MAGQTVGNLLVRIGADPNPLIKALDKVERSMMRFSGKMENIGRTLSTTLTLPILGTGAAALKAFGDFEKLEKGMTTIMGSAELAGAELKRLQKSAEAPGLGFEQAVAGSIRLQAVGLSADEARKTLEEFGNAIATTGGGAEDLDQVTRQLTQMISKNRILQEDFMVLQERMPLVSKAMQGAFGHSNIELIRESGMGAREFVARLTEEMGKFDRVEGGFSNAFENMMMSAKTAMAQIGEAINNSLDVTGKMEAFAEWIQKAANWFDGLSDAAKRNILIAAGVVAAIGPVLIGLATMAKLTAAAAIGFKLLTTAVLAVNPVVLIIVAIASALVLAYNKSERFRAAINGLGAVLKEVVTIFSEAIGAFVQGFQQLSEGEFRKAGKSFQEALIKSNPVALAITQGQRLASAYKDSYEATIQKAADEKAFDPYKDKDKLIKDMNATGAAAGAAFSEGMAAGQSGSSGGESSTPGPAIQTVSPFEPLKKDLPQVSSLLSGINLQVSKVRDTITQGANGIAFFMDNLGTGIQGFADKFGEVFGMLNETVQMFFANQAAAIDANYEKQRASIEGSTMNEENKAKAIAALDEATDKKKRALMRKQAVREKIMAMFQAAINTAGAIINALKTDPTGILAAIVGGISAVQIGMIAGAKLPALAKGGLAYGPSMVMVGDNPGARVDPEVISPLSELKDMTSSGVQRVIVEGRISGKDILLSSERAGNDRIRTRGY